MAKHGYLHLARTLHVYLTMFSSVVLFLFAFTGLVLNHEAWFGLGKGRVAPPRPAPSSVETRLEGAGGPPSRDGEMAAKRGSVEMRLEGAGGPPSRDGEMAAKRDAGERASGRAPTNRGFLSKLTSLHKGKPSSLATTLLIDVTAIVLMLGSITGVILLVAIAPRRRLGLTLMGVGTLGAVLVFLFFAP